MDEHGYIAPGPPAASSRSFLTEPPVTVRTTRVDTWCSIRRLLIVAVLIISTRQLTATPTLCTAPSLRSPPILVQGIRDKPRRFGGAKDGAVHDGILK